MAGIQTNCSLLLISRKSGLKNSTGLLFRPLYRLIIIVFLNCLDLFYFLFSHSSYDHCGCGTDCQHKAYDHGHRDLRPGQVELVGPDIFDGGAADTVGREIDPTNHLLMHAMGPNVAGVIGSAVAAGILLSFLG